MVRIALSEERRLAVEETLTARVLPWGETLVMEDRYSFGDHHYGPGEGHPLEDFHRDRVLDGFVRKTVYDRRPGAWIELTLAGDMEDPLAIDRDGWSGHRNMTESEGIALFDRIVAAHPLVYAAYAWFIRQPATRLVKMNGNHDQFFLFRGVQARFIEVVAGDDADAASRIVFVDDRMDQSYLRRLVYDDHGHNTLVDPPNNVPNDSVITARFGRPLPEPELRSILGNELIVLLMNPLKRRHMLIGRLRDESRIWPVMAMFEHEWVLEAFFRMLWVAVYLTLTGIWKIALGTGWLTAIRTAWAVARSNFGAIFASAGEEAARKKNKRHTELMMAKGRAAGARVVVSHHTHRPVRYSEDGVTYVNTGSGTTQYKLVDPPLDEMLRWKRLRWLEAPLRRLQLLDSRQKIVRALRIAAMLASVAVFAITSVVFDEWRVMSIDLSGLKWLLFAALPPVAASIILRAFAVESIRVDDTEFTFVRIRHDADDADERNMTVDLLRYVHDEDAFRDWVA